MEIPSWDARLINLERAAESQTYADEVLGILDEHGLALTDLASHLQGQLVALHPAFDLPADSFAPAARAIIPGSASSGQASSCCWRQSFTAAGPDEACHLFRYPAVALSLPLSAVAGRVD